MADYIFLFKGAGFLSGSMLIGGRVTQTQGHIYSDIWDVNWWEGK